MIIRKLYQNHDGERMNQITNEQDIIGKTITDIKHLSYSGLLALFFEQEYALYEVELGWDRGEEEVTFTGEEQEACALRDLGVITEDEYETARLASKTKAQEWQRNRRLAEYKKLKKEFENE